MSLCLYLCVQFPAPVPAHSAGATFSNKIYVPDVSSFEWLSQDLLNTVSKRVLNYSLRILKMVE